MSQVSNSVFSSLVAESSSFVAKVFIISLVKLSSGISYAQEHSEQFLNSKLAVANVIDLTSNFSLNESLHRSVT